MPASPTDAHTMQCMEVWGGNQAIDNGVVMPGLDAWVFASPHGGSAGGDIHYVSSCATGRITRFLLADVSGHGEGVSGIATALRNLMRRYVNVIDQKAFARALNREFAAHSDDGTFATAVFGTYFAPGQRLVLCNAGHPRPFLYRARDRAWSAIGIEPTESGPANLPLGILEPTTYDERAIHLATGDMVLVYSDSLIERRGIDGRMIGEAGLLAALASIGAADSATLIRRLIEQLGGIEEDDATAMLMRANSTRMRRGIGSALRGTADFWGIVARRALGREAPPIPWPDMSAANMLGLFSDRLGRALTPRDSEERR